MSLTVVLLLIYIVHCSQFHQRDGLCYPCVEEKYGYGDDAGDDDATAAGVVDPLETAEPPRPSHRNRDAHDETSYSVAVEPPDPEYEEYLLDRDVDEENEHYRYAPPTIPSAGLEASPPPYKRRR